VTRNGRVGEAGEGQAERPGVSVEAAGVLRAAQCRGYAAARGRAAGPVLGQQRMIRPVGSR